MWNLSGDDIHQAKEELKSRRAAIKARYESEIKQLEADIAAIETFERAAVDFVSNFKPAAGSSAAAADPPAEPASEGQTTSSETSAAESAVAEPAPEGAAPAAEPATAERSSSRWRMRLNTREGAA